MCLTFGMDSSGLMTEFSGQLSQYTANISYASSGSASCVPATNADVARLNQAVLHNQGWTLVKSSSGGLAQPDFIYVYASTTLAVSGGYSTSTEVSPGTPHYGNQYFILSNSTGAHEGVQCSYYDGNLTNSALSGMRLQDGWHVSLTVNMQGAQFGAVLEYSQTSDSVSSQLVDAIAELASLYNYETPAELVSDAGGWQLISQCWHAGGFWHPWFH